MAAAQDAPGVLALLTALTVAIVLALTAAAAAREAPATAATAVGSRALAPSLAVAVVAAAAFVGGMLGERVARTVASGLLTPPPGAGGLGVVLAGAAGAAAWGVVARWRALPSSSSHALVGGLLGAALAASAQVRWAEVSERVLLPLVLVPAVALVLAHVLSLGLLWAFRHATPAPAYSRFRAAQTLTATAVALGHGLQAAQVATGVVVLALVAGGLQGADDAVPLWVRFAAASALAVGALWGGWRSGRGGRAVHAADGGGGPGRGVARLDPPRGFAAEVSAASALVVSALLRAPASSVHVVPAAVAGAGTTRGLSAVRWDLARRTSWAWLLVLPGSAALGAVCHLLLVSAVGWAAA